MVRGLRVTYAALAVLWILANVFFWDWWLRPEHVASPWMYWLFTLAFFYEASFLPSMYLFFVGRMRRPRDAQAPAATRVALITLCVPSSETLEVIVQQLAAMAAVRYPHESWVLDEGHDPRVRAAAERLGVRYFSRRGIPRYNQDTAPFKAKTKAGNVNAWLDLHGHRYDYFVQFDIDHRPAPEYLDRVLGHFDDPDVAWVQGPSIYGNLRNWVARGSAEQELVLQGPLQAGFYGNSETPFIIGSHCTYRTRAVLEINGFQPTRAEDHLDTVILASRGYRGVFIPQPLAWGAGPETFETYLRQQFAWAFSMMQVLFQFTPRLVRSYRPGQALQFLFAQTWYALWSSAMLVLFSVPLVALLTGHEPANVPMWQFVLSSAPMGVTALVIWLWTRPWQLPSGLQLTWRGVVLHVARWPIVFWALLNVLLRVQHPYMITPKGAQDGLPPFSMRSQALYLVAAWLSVLVVWSYLWRGSGRVDGFVMFALLGAVYMLAVVGTNVAADLSGLRRRGLALFSALRVRALPVALLAATASATLVTASAGSETIAYAVTWQDGAHPSSTDVAGAEHAREILQWEYETSSATGSPILDMPLPGRPARPAPVSLPLPLAAHRVTVGAYDPWQQMDRVSYGLEHWYVRQDRPDLLAGALAHARNRHTIMVTVEAFPRPGQRTPPLDAIVRGEKDAELRALAHVVRSAAPQEVLIRWGHEMDLSGLYPWSANDSAMYRAAFRRVVELFRDEGAKNARWVWSPAGEANAIAYYPGEDVVDYVGLTVLGDREWDTAFGLPRQSFVELLEPRYQRMVGFGKPIVLAEVGVSGTDAEQAAWLTAAAVALPQFDLVRAVSYFVDRNAPNNRLSRQPDWRLTPGTFAAFREAVEVEGLLTRGWRAA